MKEKIKEMIENAPFTAGDVISKDNIKYKIISIQVISESRKFSKFIFFCKIYILQKLCK